VRTRPQLIVGPLFLLHGIAEWFDLSAIWKIPIGVATFVCVMLMVAEGQNRKDSHVTLNLRG
jgi:hypothetical protein